MILNINLSALHSSTSGILMKLYLRKVLHWLAADIGRICAEIVAL